jgi:HEAT repeats
MKSAWPSALITLLLTFVPAPLCGDERNPGDEAVLKAAGLTCDGPALVRFFQQRTLTEADRARLAAEARRLGADSFRERERAMRELRAAGRSALPFVRPATNHADPEVARRAERLVRELEGGGELALARAAARLLADQRPADSAGVVLRFLPSADDGLLEDELVAALAAVASPGGRIDPAVAEAVKDAAPVRRGGAAWVLGRSSRADERAMARPLLADLDPAVRFRAARALLAAREKEAVPALVALLGDAPPAIGWEVEEILFRLAGEGAPQVAVGEGTDVERRQCREAWESWWRDRGGKLELSKVELPDRRPGHAVFVCFEGYQSGRGRVWEVGADGRIVWQLDNITGASDAQVLAGNRLLVSEYFGDAGVKERDLAGKVLWKHRFINTLAGQRLPHGNTFVASVDELVELSPQGKPVFSFKRKDSAAICCARKLRDGHYACACQGGLMVELDGRGQTVRSFQAGLECCSTFDALPNGHYLVPQGGTDKVVEFNRAGKVVWECHVPGANTAARLPYGRTLVGTGQQQGPHSIVEVDRWGQVTSEQPVKGRVFRIVGR